MSAAIHVVVVDDEAALREPVVDYLRLQGLDAHAADGGAELDRLIPAGPVDVVVLDVNMPGEDGISIARRLRAQGGIGIIMLTSRRDVFDRVVGLEVGADDYVTKPFELRELLARIRSVARRLVPPQTPQTAAREACGDFKEEFWVAGKVGLMRIDVRAIDWIEAAKDYILLHTEGRSHILRSTMGAVAQSVDPQRLLRVHRSAFVRLKAVASVKAASRNAYLTLHSGAVIPVGPQYLEDLQRRLGLPG